MPYLLLSAAQDDCDAAIGGHPMAGDGFRWPTCRACRGPMRYIARLPLSETLEVAAHGAKLLLLFQCEQNPGACDEWDPDAGGNAALIVDASDAREVAAPDGESVMGTRGGVSLLAYDESTDADSAEDEYYEVYGAPDSRIIGKAAGLPIWIQGDETPTCSCGATMRFVVQLEERAADGLNFGGGGSAYAFVCPTCREQARFLWQC